MLRVIFGHKSYNFLLAPINIESVKPNFTGVGSVLEVIRLKKATLYVLVTFYLLGNSVLCYFLPNFSTSFIALIRINLQSVYNNPYSPQGPTPSNNAYLSM